MRLITLFFLHLTFCQTVLAASSTDSLAPNSIYNLNSTWTNQDGKQVKLGDYRGHPVLLSLMYLTCTYSCPTLINQIISVEEKMSPERRAELKIVLVSFDPKRDTPQKMKQYMARRKLDSTHWTFMTQNDEAKIRELAAVLNFKYKKQDDGEFIHSSQITGLDRKGIPLEFSVSATDDVLQKMFQK